MQTVNRVRGRYGREAAILSAIFLLALALRAIAVVRTATIFNDGPIFLQLARWMGQGEWAQALAHPYHPLYPLLIRVVQWGVPDWEQAAVVVSLVAGSTAVLALYAFLHEAWDARVAAIGALLLAIHPYAIRFAADVQSDALYLAFFLAAVAVLFRALRSGRAWLAGMAGALSGLAYLTRPEGVGVVVVGVALASAAALRGGWRARQAARWVLALGTGLLGVAAPYVLALHRFGGGWQFSQKKSLTDLLGLGASLRALAALPAVWLVLGAAAIVIALLALRQKVGRDRIQAIARIRIGARALLVIGFSAALLLALLAPEQAAIFAAESASALRPELCLLVAIGIGSRVSRDTDGRALFLVVFSALYASILLGLVLNYGYLSRRHALPPLTLLLGQAALGAFALGRWFDRRARPRSPVALVRPGRGARVGVALVLMGVASLSLPKALRDHRSEQLAGRLAAEWLAEQGADAGAVAAEKRKFAYYARRPWRPLRVDGALRSLAVLERENVHYLLLEDDLLDARLAPTQALWADGRSRLRERHRASAKQHAAVVFELLPASD